MRHADLFENCKCPFALACREYLKRLDTAISSHFHDLQNAQRELRIESRAIFVVDKDGKVGHAEYVKEVANHPDYDAALSKARELAG